MKIRISLCLALLLCAGLAVPARATQFPDVPDGHYAASAIDNCVARGVVSGYAGGAFLPDATLTRTQFCVMLSRAFYPSGVAKNDNVALRGLGWFVPNTRTLFMANVLEGTSFSGKYNQPDIMNVPISRYDMAQLMANIMLAGGRSAGEAEKAAAQAQIRDWASVPENYRDAVASCYALGLLGGLRDGTFGGSGAMNRAQGCAVIDRMSPYIEPDSLPADVKKWPPVPASEPQAPSQPVQPTQPSQPAQPAGNPNLPEIRCASCGYLMRRAGSTELDFNNGGASNAFFRMCDICNKWYLCQQCARYETDANFDQHRHREVCASGGLMAPVEDFYSPSYRGSLYYRQLKNVTLTGNYRQDILAVAASQIGYRGSSDPNQLDGSRGGGSHTEYNWALSFDGESDAAWCSEFASWCARQAEIPTSILHSSRGACPDDFGGTAYSWSDTVFAGGSYLPRPGDLMLICHSSRAVSTSDSMDHTTIVESVSQNGDRVTITVIDGNSNNSVRRHDYTYNASRGMTGFFVAPSYP